MDSPKYEEYLTFRIVIIVAITGACTFFVTIPMYLGTAILTLIVMNGTPPLGGPEVAVQIPHLVRPDVWIYFIAIAIGFFLASRKWMLDRKKILDTADYIYVGTKFMILLSLVYPICSDLIGHAIVGYWPEYLTMYSTFVAILALLTFPVVMFRKIEQLLPIIPILILFYFGTPILVIVGRNILFYEIILVELVAFFLIIEAVAFIAYKYAQIRRETKTRYDA